MVYSDPTAEDPVAAQIVVEPVLVLMVVAVAPRGYRWRTVGYCLP